MMFGVNLFSCLFTSISLLEQGGFYEAFVFMAKYSDFVVLNIILSVSGVLLPLVVHHFATICYIVDLLKKLDVTFNAENNDPYRGYLLACYIVM